MRVQLKYGTMGLKADLPETESFAGILKPNYAAPLAAPAGKLEFALARPIDSPSLREVARGKKNACIVISDLTRPVPNKLLLPPILRVLQQSGIPRDQILILIATGTHRPNEGSEMEKLVGADIAERFQVRNHICRDAREMVFAGDVPNAAAGAAAQRIFLNRAYVDAELKILTGFIEPHMWAGFSGGRKAILPGISSLETVQFMHGPEMIASPMTAYGILSGNPFHEASMAIMRKVGADFAVNVTLDTDKKVTGIFAGNPATSHEQGCAELARQCVLELDEPLDFVVTTNSGAPLDCNLYQTVKGMAAAAPAVRARGGILIASACSEGIGSREYEQTLDLADSPDNFLARLMKREFFIPEQWCAQETYQVIRRNPTWLVTGGIPRRKVEQYHFQWADSVESGVAELIKKYGRYARWAIVPDGPMLILRAKGKPPTHKA